MDELEHGDLLWVRERIQGHLLAPTIAQYNVDCWLHGHCTDEDYDVACEERETWLTFFGTPERVGLDEVVVVCKFRPPVPVIE